MQTYASMSGSEEEEGDELATIAIKTHNLRAEKVRRETELASRQEMAEKEIAEMKARIAAAREELLDLDMADLTAERVPERRPRPAPRFDPVAADLEFDIENNGRLVAELRDQLEQQEAQQKAEIKKLMRKITKAKNETETINAQADEKDEENQAKRERVDWLRMEIRAMRQEIVAAKQETGRKERKFQRLAADADAIVHKVYRTKSRHVH
jgi:hypothetical protein